MLRLLNNLIKKPGRYLGSEEGRRSFQRDIVDSRGGQAVIVLLLIIAIALVFYAVVLNLTRVSQTKIQVTIAANATASHLASLMASYGEYLLQNTFLEGQRLRCKFSGTFFVDFILKLIAYLIINASFGIKMFLTLFDLLHGPTPYSLRDMIVGFGTGGAILNNIPGDTIITKWNREQLKTMSPEDQFVEQGIMTGFQRIVTDGKNVCDYRDMDEDGVFGIDPATGKCRDSVGRYTLYYNARMDRIQPPDYEAIKDFLDDLDSFIFVEDYEDWGLFDPINCGTNPRHRCCGSSKPAYCNECCVPMYDPEGLAELAALSPPINCPTDPSERMPRECEAILIRDPEICPETDTYYENICANNASYGPYNPYLYDKLVDDIYNDDTSNNRKRRSFREKVGRDDRNIFYTRDYSSTDPEAQTFRPSTGGADLFNEFRIEDTTISGNAPEGIFPFLHKMWDWGIDLAGSQASGYDDRLECLWADPNFPPSPAGCGITPPANNYMTISRLSLPVDPSATPMINGVPYTKRNNTPFVDGVNPFSGGPPLKVDKVGVVDGLLTPEDACSDISTTLWKKGSDHYCSVEVDAGVPAGYNGFIDNTGSPYWARCLRHGSTLCTDGPSTPERLCFCGEGNSVPSLWSNDTLDVLLAEIDYFIEWGQGILAQEVEDLANNIEAWYPSAAQWIEPAGQSPTYLDEPGQLWQMLDTLRAWQTAIDGWLEDNYEAGRWTEEWCYSLANSPPTGRMPNEPYMTQEEDAVIRNAEATSSLDAVVACLDWNVNDALASDIVINNPTAECPATGAKGNACKFYACMQDCNEANCSDLPRSLVPGFDPSFSNPNAGDRQKFEDCLTINNSTNIDMYDTLTEACIADHSPGGTYACANLPSGAPYNLPAWNSHPINGTNITALRNCAQNYGTLGGRCPVGNLSLEDPLLVKNQIEGSICREGGYGSCCEWRDDTIPQRFYDWEPGNSYYDAIQNLLDGNSCNNWDLSNVFYADVHNLLGTCVIKTLSPALSPFMQSLDPNNNPLIAPVYQPTHPLHNDLLLCATLCSFWPENKPGGGQYEPCEMCSHCEVLAANASLGLQPFNQGFFDPTVQDNYQTMSSLYQCFVQCSEGNCGNLSPVINNNGDSHDLPPFTGTSVVADPGHRVQFERCLDSAGPAQCTLNCSNLPAHDPDNPLITYDLPPFAMPNVAIRDGYRSCALSIGGYPSPCEGDLSDTPTCGPAGDVCSGGPCPQLACDDPNLTKSKINELICANAGYCCDPFNTFANSPNRRPFDWGEDGGDPNRFYELVKVARDRAAMGSSCGDTSVGGWVDQVAMSYHEAVNQVAKFEKRLEILKPLVEEAKEAKATIDEAVTEVERFLTRAQDLVTYMQNQGQEEALSKQAIYFWKDDDPQGDEEGRWHGARVDVRLPKRCSDYLDPNNGKGTCGINKNTGQAGLEDPRWPWIYMYQRGVLDSTWCMKLRDHTGMVKAKITRFDEEKKKDRPVRFPGGLLWIFRSSNPNRATTGHTEEELIDRLEDFGVCGKFMDPLTENASNAFMLDGRLKLIPTKGSVPGEYGNKEAPDECWDVVNELLARGVTAKTCAEYFLRPKPGSSSHYSMSMKFIECDPYF